MTVDAALTTFFDHYYSSRPVQATFTGIHEHDGRLPDWSPEGLDEQLACMRALRRVLADAGCVPDDRVRQFPAEVDLALADGYLDIQIAEHESGHFLHRNPALWTGEAIFAVISLVARPFAPLDARLESVASRMRALPEFLQSARRVLRSAPAAWKRRALRECSAGTRLLAASLPRWWSGKAPLPDQLAGELNAIATAAAAAFESFSTWLEVELPLAPVEDASAGSTLLEVLLRRGHWCRTPLDELLEEARGTLKEAAAELDRRCSRLAPGGWPEVQTRLAASHPTVEDYIPRFERTWHACREMALRCDLVTWPEAEIRYLPIPEQTRDVAPDLYYLLYRSPAPFDDLPIHEYVVTPVTPDMSRDEQQRRLRATNDSVITLNHVVHHGALGHHVQNFYAARSRSRIGQVAAVDGASRIGMFSGGTLAEGWACYACDLAEETGFLSPLEQAAQQHARVRLLTRAVADLELHSGRRTLAEVAALYRESVAMPPEAADAEAVKNSMFPGAAVMYWLGTRDLHTLRRNMETRLGSSFTLRTFHDRVLSHGAIPVPLIARLMMEGA